MVPFDAIVDQVDVALRRFHLHPHPIEAFRADRMWRDVLAVVEVAAASVDQRQVREFAVAALDFKAWSGTKA